ncbi:MAG TPA: class I SAM-dependent methyltransferase [Holophaga sp.]|nr:class I SAM-dependent methyltransferase [Holophaga sp.]
MAVNRFEREAARWDEAPRRVALAQAVAEAIREQVPLSGTEAALDYGCGTGLLTLALRPAVGRITGVDTSAAMLSRLEAKLTEVPDTGVDAVLLDPVHPLRSLPPVDLITSSMTLHHVTDLPDLFADFHALLRPGGRIALADLEAEDGTFHEDPEGVVHHGFNPEALLGLLAAAGFTDLRATPATVVTKGERPYRVFLATGLR